MLQGPNGSGKSSLIRVLAGLLPPASGRITWSGVDVAQDPDGHRARLAFIGHLDAVKPVFTVAENLAFWAGLAGKGGDIAAALTRFGLARIADLPARYLSAGQKRRLALARLAATSAPLWLLDEPAVSLDKDGVAVLSAAIAGHRARGGLVVAASHGDIVIADAQVLRLGAVAP